MRPDDQTPSRTHKGMRAVMGECGSLGPNGKIACPYHGWEYVPHIVCRVFCLIPDLSQ